MPFRFREISTMFGFCLVNPADVSILFRALSQPGAAVNRFAGLRVDPDIV